jgi:hypothetical protein
MTIGFVGSGRMTGMCGRFVIAANKAAIRDASSVGETFQDEVKPSWNVAPMQGIPFTETCEGLDIVRRRAAVQSKDLLTGPTAGSGSASVFPGFAGECAVASRPSTVSHREYS